MTTITIPKTEYNRLKKIDRQFSVFLAYLDSISDIRRARNEVKRGRVISQEKLFKRIGF